MTYDELVSSVHVGTVWMLDLKRKIGYIRQNRIHDLTGWDVRFRPWRTGVCSRCVGDILTFRVELDTMGRPWVCDDQFGSRSTAPTPRDIWDGLEDVGEPWRPCTNIPPIVYGHGNTGAHLELENDVGPLPLTVESLSREEHSGVITDYFEHAGYGFIHNAAIHRLCGHDVRFQAWQAPSYRFGDAVVFRVRLNVDGLPRAIGPVRHACASSMTAVFPMRTGGINDDGLERVLREGGLYTPEDFG